MLGCLGFVTLVAGLRVRLVEAAGHASQLPALALVGAADRRLAGCSRRPSTLPAGSTNDIKTATAATFHHSVDIFFVGAELAAILPLAAVMRFAWRTRVLPRWWAAFSGLSRWYLSLIEPIGWLGLIFGVPIWTLGTSLFVLLGSRERAQAAVATA